MNPLIGIGVLFFLFLPALSLGAEEKPVPKVVLEEIPIPKLPPNRYDLSFYYGNSTQNTVTYAYRFALIDPPSAIKYSIEGWVSLPNPTSGVGIENLNRNDHGIAIWNWLILPWENAFNLSPRVGYRWVEAGSTGFTDRMDFFFYGLQIRWNFYPGGTTFWAVYDNASPFPELSMNRYLVAFRYRISYSLVLETGYASMQYPQNLGFFRPLSLSLVTSDSYFLGVSYAF